MNTEEWSDKPKKLEGGFIFAPYLPYSETPEADEQEFYKKYGKTMNMHQAAAYASEDKLVKKSLNLFFGIEEKEETKETKVIEKDSREIQFPITSKQEYFIYSVIIKKTFDSAKKSFTGYGKSTSIQVGYDEYVTAPINGFFFINDPDGNIICFEFNAEFYTIHIKSETTFVNDLYNVIISEFENNNFYKFKNMEVTQNGVKFHKPNHATFESVILDKKLKDDIYLNSIYFLENFDGSNGMIFEGPECVSSRMLIFSGSRCHNGTAISRTNLSVSSKVGTVPCTRFQGRYLTTTIAPHHVPTPCIMLIWCNVRDKPGIAVVTHLPCFESE